MPELSKKLERFTSILLAEAAAENERTLNELKEKHDAALTAAEDQVLQEAYDYIHTEVSRIRAEEGRKISQRLMENKRTLSLRREEIAQEVFAQVRSRIEAFTKTPAYARRLAALLQEALRTLGNPQDAVVTLRQADLSLEQELRRAVPAHFTIEAGPIQLGGAIVRSPEKNLRCDASFDVAMEDLDGHFARVAGLSLSGDPAGPTPGKEA